MYLINSLPTALTYLEATLGRYDIFKQRIRN